jgi:hypothetical protein
MVKEWQGILSLAWLANATYIPSLVKVNAADIATRGVNGYRVEGHTQFTKYATERYPLTPRVAMSAALTLTKEGTP